MNIPLNAAQLRKLTQPNHEMRNPIVFIEVAIPYFKGREYDTFEVPHDLEGRFSQQYAGRIIDDPLFQALDALANANGWTTDGTFGSFSEAVGIGQFDVHNLACACTVESGQITGAEMVRRLQYLLESYWNIALTPPRPTSSASGDRINQLMNGTG